MLKKLLLILLFTVSLSTQALDLKTAKTEGLVAETLKGYLAIVKNNTTNKNIDAVKKLVERINSKRNKIYKKLAQENNIKISDVEKLSAKKAIEKTTAGNYIENAKGEFIVKN